jgi:hypothetical protein
VRERIVPNNIGFGKLDNALAAERTAAEIFPGLEALTCEHEVNHSEDTSACTARVGED